MNLKKKNTSFFILFSVVQLRCLDRFTDLSDQSIYNEDCRITFPFIVRNFRSL